MGAEYRDSREESTVDNRIILLTFLWFIEMIDTLLSITLFPSICCFCNPDSHQTGMTCRIL